MKPFVAQAADVRVIDGDTIALHGGFRQRSLRIRLRSIDAPERARMSPSLQETLMARTLSAHGLAPARNRKPPPLGERARAFLRETLRDRCLLVHPAGFDRYGRMKADIFRSGEPGDEFVAPGAQSVAHLLLNAGLAGRFRNRSTGALEPLPPEYPFGPARAEEPDATPSPEF